MWKIIANMDGNEMQAFCLVTLACIAATQMKRGNIPPCLWQKSENVVASQKQHVAIFDHCSERQRKWASEEAWNTIKIRGNVSEWREENEKSESEWEVAGVVWPFTVWYRGLVAVPGRCSSSTIQHQTQTCGIPPPLRFPNKSNLPSQARRQVCCRTLPGPRNWFQRWDIGMFFWTEKCWYCVWGREGGILWKRFRFWWSVLDRYWISPDSHSSGRSGAQNVFLRWRETKWKVQQHSQWWNKKHFRITGKILQPVRLQASSVVLDTAGLLSFCKITSLHPA